MIQVADRIRQDVPAKSPCRLAAEHVGCDVCGQSQHQRLFTERYTLGASQVQLGINRCAECGQVYVSPRLVAASVAEVYRLDAARTISHNYCWSGAASDKRFEPMLNRLTRCAPRGRLLDVGCGNGSFLAAAAKRNRWQLVGLEPVAAAASAAARQTSAEIHNCPMESATLTAASFDVVSLLGVLEHLHTPRETLVQVHRLLRPGGFVAVYVPNFHYLRLKDTGPVCWLRTGRWSNLAPQEHLFHFTAGSIRRLLQQTGFQVRRLDVGRPFLGTGRPQRLVKQAAYAATVALRSVTGVHLGGLEVIAQKEPRS